MEPYILTRVIMSEILRESQERARLGARESRLGNLLVRLMENSMRSYLIDSASSVEKTSMRIWVCYL